MIGLSFKYCEIFCTCHWNERHFQKYCIQWECLNFDWSSFLRVWLKISQHWFMWWRGAEEAPRHCLNQYITQVQWRRSIYVQPIHDEACSHIYASQNGFYWEPFGAKTIFEPILLSSEPQGTNFTEMWVKILTFPCKKIHLKNGTCKCRFFPPGSNVHHCPSLTRPSIHHLTPRWWPPCTINSLALRRFERNFIELICELIVIKGLGIRNRPHTNVTGLYRW